VLLESAPDAAIIINAEGEIVLVNTQTERFFGYNRDELIGKPVEMLIPESHRMQHPAHRADYVAAPHVRGMGVGLELYAQRQDGSQFPVEISLSPIKTQAGLRVSSAIRDITERQKIQQALQESEERYRGLFDQIEDAIFIHDEESNILDVNQTACTRLGYTRDELLKMKTADIDEPNYAQHFQDRLKHQFQDGKLLDIEGMHITRNKEKIPIHVNSRTIIYKGHPAVLAVARDITERKKAEQEILELAGERQRANLLSDFIKNISHDFRSPLTVINNSLYLFSKTTNPEKQKKYLENTEHQTSRLTHLLDKLVTMVRLDSPITLVFQPYDLNLLVNDLCTILEQKAENKSIKVLRSIWGSKLMVHIDINELNLALAELGENALSYTPLGGIITIRTLQHEHHAVIELSDTGIGIDAANFQNIFQPLYRVDDARSAQTGGSGLGLPIAKRIIELHQGTIGVESIVGEGSTFRVSLPLSE
jgi:PAS domain S-box-containing protein